MIKLVFWPVFGAMIAVYAVMLVWTLPTISAEADGLAPFDMRPLGYSFDEAKAFLSALSAAGKDLYLRVQQMLDLFYPALLAVTLILATLLLTASRWLRLSLAALAAAGMVFDYRENFFVGRMLEYGPDGIAPDLVASASGATVVKSIFDAVSMIAVLTLTVGWLLARRRVRR